MTIKFDIKPNSPAITGILTESALPGLYQLVWSFLITHCPDGGGVGSIKLNYIVENEVEELDDTAVNIEGINGPGNHWEGTQVIANLGNTISFRLAPDQNFDGTDYAGTLRLALVGPL